MQQQIEFEVMFALFRVLVLGPIMGVSLFATTRLFEPTQNYKKGRVILALSKEIKPSLKIGLIYGILIGLIVEIIEILL